MPRAGRVRAVALTLDHRALGLQLLRFWLFFALVSLALFSTRQAWGQGYQEEKLPEVPRATVTAMERAKSEGLTKPDFSPQWAGYDDLRKYYLYQFAKLKDPAFSAEYGKIMQSMLDDVERSQRARTPAAATVSGWIVAGAGRIAAENFHPAARVNATLLLGLVDEQGADVRNGQPPRPARGALIPLIRLYTTATNPDGVRAAALQGLVRHVNLGAVTNAQHRAGLASVMLTLAQSDPPAGRSPEAHAYMQRYAVDILSVLANPNVADQTAQTLVSLSTAGDKPSLIAAYAASKIGQLQPGRAKLNQPSRVLNSWAARAAATIEQEIDRLAKLDPPTAVRDQPAMPTERTPRRMGGGFDGGAGMDDYAGEMMMEMEAAGSYDMGGGMDDMMMMEMEGMGMMPGMMPQAKPQPVEIIASRRRINHVLQQLQVGVTGRATTGKPPRPAGLLVAATDQDQAAFDAWIQSVAGVVTAVNDQALDDRTKYVEALKLQATALKTLAGVPVQAEQPGDAAVALEADQAAALPPEGDPNAGAPLVPGGPIDADDVAGIPVMGP